MERTQDEVVVKAIHALVREYPRYGYRRIHRKLRKQGFEHNKKVTYRLWRKEGFKVPRKRKKRRSKGKSVNAQHISPSTHVNDAWAWDYVHDVDTSGRTIRWLVLTDEYTRELLILEPRRSFPARAAQASLLSVIAERGLPKRLRSDNGSEFTEDDLQTMLGKSDIESCCIDPGKPWQNGKAESLNSRLRDEFFEMHEFNSLRDAKPLADQFKHAYNHEREHSALGYQTPAEFAATVGCPVVVASLLPPASQPCTMQPNPSSFTPELS